MVVRKEIARKKSNDSAVIKFAVLLVTLLAGPAEEFFFEYPRKALTEFFQSLKTKKQPPKMNNVQHYHLYYYPLPLVPPGWMKAPDKRQFDRLYEDNLASLGWMDSWYMPDSSSIVLTSFQQPTDTNSGNQKTADSNADMPATIAADSNIKGLMMRIPVNQQFVLHLIKRKRSKEMSA